MTVEYSVADGVATIALNRPEVRNALNLEMCIALLDATARAEKDPSVKVVFVRGNGPVFCGGADLKERQGKSEQWIRERRLKAFAAYEALEALPMPCVALVQGAAIGSGVEIAGACDFIVATPDATFRTPEAQRGTVGATQRLPRILGKRLAKDMMFTGRALAAEEARVAGFVARIVLDLDAAGAEIAEAILKAPPLALRLGKRAIDRGIELDPKGARQAEIEAIEEQLASGQWMGKTLNLAIPLVNSASRQKLDCAHSNAMTEGSLEGCNVPFVVTALWNSAFFYPQVSLRNVRRRSPFYTSAGFSALSSVQWRRLNICDATWLGMRSTLACR